MVVPRSQARSRIYIGLNMKNIPNICEKQCENSADKNTRLIVITGGPGAGKTAVLEMAKKVLCRNIVILPEAASILFGGGFWRLQSASAKQAAQSAIFHIQVEIENLAIGEEKWSVGLCDRGTVDGLAYWPNSEKTFWEMSGSQLSKEYQKYLAVIHLRSPTDLLGYNQQNPLRIESSIQAEEIDEKIAHAWKDHPNYSVIESTENFLTKAQTAMKVISKFIPDCCQSGIKKITDTKIELNLIEKRSEQNNKLQKESL